MDEQDLKNRFTHHAPNPEQIQKYTYLRNSAKVPESREKSLAITHLEEVVMWANAGIARQDG
jgi:hypothetical protein